MQAARQGCAKHSSKPAGRLRWNTFGDRRGGWGGDVRLSGAPTRERTLMGQGTILMTVVSIHSRRQAQHWPPDGPWWQTVRAARRVLVMVPTITSAKRLLDISSLFHGDLRVQMLFTVPPDVFNRGAAELLAAHGAPLVPWAQATGEPFDLAITANFGHLDAVDAPVAVFSHGASRNSLARPRGRGALPAPGPVIGFSRSDLIRGGMLVPSALALGHERELALLERGCPEALAVAHVVGDPCYDRITAGASLRGAYRAALGVREGQKLVVATSTWRTNSLLGSAPHVLERLAGELPRAQYAVALLTHPNIWAGHGAYQVRTWLEPWTNRGLVLTDPETDWQPIVMAADWIIGDHGSVTLYGAAAGVPVLLGCFPEADVHPDSGAAALGAIAPRLSPGTALGDQLRHAADTFDPQAMSEVASLITSEPGSFARHTRSLLYRLLALGQPAFPARLAPAPAPAPLRPRGPGQFLGRVS